MKFFPVFFENRSYSYSLVETNLGLFVVAADLTGDEDPAVFSLSEAFARLRSPQLLADLEAEISRLVKQSTAKAEKITPEEEAETVEEFLDEDEDAPLTAVQLETLLEEIEKL